MTTITIALALLYMFGASPSQPQDRPSASVRGTVTNEKGESLDGTVRLVKSKEAGEEKAATTDSPISNGSFEVSDLHAGSYTIVISNDQYYSAILKEEELEAGDVAEYTAVLKRKPLASVDSVADPDDQGNHNPS